MHHVWIETLQIQTLNGWKSETMICAYQS